MNKFVISSAVALALIISTNTTRAADLYSPVDQMQYSFAATGFVSGGGAWLGGGELEDLEETEIIFGGDFLIPLDNNFNIQLGGAFRKYIVDRESDSNQFTQNQANLGAVAFWRDPTFGVFGVDLGLFKINQSTNIRYVKVGGVAQYFISDIATIGAFGGLLIDSQDDDPYPNGYYAGADATYYASDNFAVAAFARYTDRVFESGSIEMLRAGGKVRYLTAMSGVELFASAAYQVCPYDTGFGGPKFDGDGVSVMGGINIYLGGLTDSLVSIDRSNTLDTRTWRCIAPTGEF